MSSNELNKKQINAYRLELITTFINGKFKSRNAFRERFFPEISENGFNKKFQESYLHDDTLCKMERVLGIPPSHVRSFLKSKLEKEHGDVDLDTLQASIGFSLSADTTEPVKA